MIIIDNQNCFNNKIRYNANQEVRIVEYIDDNEGNKIEEKDEYRRDH